MADPSLGAAIAVAISIHNVTGAPSCCPAHVPVLMPGVPLADSGGRVCRDANLLRDGLEVSGA
eukprot:45575-Rhodomonas_salina.3